MKATIKEYIKDDKRLEGFENIKSFIEDNGWDIYPFNDKEEYERDIENEKKRYQLKSLKEGEENIGFWYDEYKVDIVEIAGELFVELFTLIDEEEEEENKLSPFTDKELIKELAKRQKQFATYELAERYVDDINEILWPLIDVKEEDE